MNLASTAHKFNHLREYALLGVLPIFAGLLPAFAATDSSLQTPQTKRVVQQQMLPQVTDKHYGVTKTIRLTVTAYSSTVDQTDSDPFTTASGATVEDGIIAYNFLPFGTRVRFPERFGNKIFVVEDRLRAGHGHYIADMWMPSRQLAQQWGARILQMEILGS